MKTFLQEAALELIARHPGLEDVSVVFPNRRAIIFFRKYLSDNLSKPAFAPKLFTFEQFVSRFSGLQVADRLDLIHRLHRVYSEVLQSAESFDKFYFWGDMLLRDFDELDKYRVNAELFFTTIRHQKEIDSRFDALTEEQRRFLSLFWSHVDMKKSGSHDRFIGLWSHLGEVYRRFTRHLREEGLAYDGMIQREAADKAGELALASRSSTWFVGFNALTACEEVLITALVAHDKGKVLWDTDEYYMNDRVQEAGEFLRSYRNKPALASTFPAQPPANFRSTKKVRLHGVAQQVGQAKVAGQLIQQEIKQGLMPEETLIVLPDEKLLLPLLHSLPEEAGSYNVTMGFPLAATPIFNLAEALINLQLSERSQYFNHRPVTSLLNHPYLMASGVGAAAAKLGEMTKENRVWVSAGWLQQGNPLFASVFTPVGQNSIIQYLLRCAERVGEISALPDLEKEYVFQFIQLLNRMNVVLGNAAMELRSFHRMLRQMVASVRIPFTGEPLRGLQIMGVLETRNLDFRNVIILSMNEGAWPAISRGGTFVPYNIRKAFGIPTQEHHDAIYGYHFYRLLQRAENIHFLYSTETDVLGQGEMSRLLRQLEFESGWKIDRHVIYPPVQPAAPVAITVHKSKAVMNRMAEYLAGSSPQRRLSPTALNAYRECRLMFYLRYVARIFELDEIEDEMDAREVGNLVHAVLERFYKGLEKRKKSRHVAGSDFDGSEEVVNKLLDEFFRERYGAHQRGEFRYEGRAVVLREVALTFINRVLHHDRQYAPFELICLEENINMDVPIGGDDRRKVALTGKVDRADRKGDSVRIVDYKTGKDSLDMKDDPGELFGRDMKSGKAVLQTMLYTYLFDRSGAGAGYKLLPGLMTRANLFKADLAFGLKFEGRPLPDVRPMLPRLEEALGDFLAELYDEKVSFDQTPEIKNCRFCAYREICSR